MPHYCSLPPILDPCVSYLRFSHLRHFLSFFSKHSFLGGFLLLGYLLVVCYGLLSSDLWVFLCFSFLMILCLVLSFYVWSSSSSADMSNVGQDVESLVTHTAALGWDKSDGASQEGWEDGEQVASLVLVGKLITDRPLHKLGVRLTIFKSFFFVKELEIEELKDNYFLFSFPSITALTCVLEQSPWNIKGLTC